MFLNSNGWQSAYVQDYRKYLYNLGYDAADISDYDLAKLISQQYRDLTATMTGKTKGMVMWHGSPKMFDRFDLASTGNYTGNMGYGGPGNYFSNARTKYGYTKENGVLNLQPYLITNVKSTPPMTIMRDKGLIPYYLSPKDYRVEEYKQIIQDLIKKTPIDDNKLYIDDISALPVGSLDPINGIRAEYLLRRNNGIKSLFPHPSVFVRNKYGTVSVIRNWQDPRVNYKIGGKLIKRKM